jgi:hypothetical protein
MNRYKPLGWRNDNYRHSLAARGLTRQSFKAIRGDNFVMSDIPIHEKEMIMRPRKVNSYYTLPQFRIGEVELGGMGELRRNRLDASRTEIMEELYPETQKRALMIEPKFSNQSGLELENNLQLAKLIAFHNNRMRIPIFHIKRSDQEEAIKAVMLRNPNMAREEAEEFVKWVEYERRSQFGNEGPDDDEPESHYPPEEDGWYQDRDGDDRYE